MSLSIVAAEPEEFRARVVVPLPRRRFVAPDAHARRPVVDVVLPVFNDERDLRACVTRLHAFLAGHFPFTARITIADGASTDATPEVAAALAAELRDVRVLRVNERGRARAVAAAWLTSDARVVMCMDVDCSADLHALLPLVAPVISGHSEISIGGGVAGASRLAGAYNLLLRLVLRVRFKDAHRRLKAIRADVARRLVPAVANRNSLFDTELLVRAELAGLRIHEMA